MKKILLALFTISVALFAVEWEIEQVTVGPDYWNDWPMIAVDNQGNVGIVYDQYGEVEDSLVFASNATGSWIIEGIMPTAGWASFDFDSKGNAWVALVNTYDWDDTTEIFLATDTSGEFTVTQLTNDPQDRYIPVIRLDEEDNLHIIYPQSVGEEPDDTTLLFYGWIDEGSFHSELITDQLSGYNYDMVVDRNNTPHVFFSNWIGETGNLWHAFLSPLNQNPTWDVENIFNTGSFFPVLDPNATVDSEGDFHVAFNVLGINYITNKTGEWVNDPIVDSVEEPIEGEYPVIAVDPKNNPYIAYLWCDEESETPGFYLLSKDTNGWNQEEVFISDKDEITADDRRFFTIDAQGYGHVTYAEWSYGEEDVTGYVYHAKTKEPFVPGVADSPVEITSFDLEIRGSTVCFSLPHTSLIRLSLYDACGRLLDHLASGTYPQGEHSLPINASDLSSGVYLVRIEAGRQSASVKFVVTK